jgi:type II secretion system protein L
LQATAVIRVLQGKLAWYPPGSSDEPQWLDNDLSREKLRATLAQRKVTVCFAVPGADVRLLSMTLGADEKKHIGKSLPFMLEEQVAQEIEDLHFATGALQQDSLAVGLCSHQAMQQWQALLAEFPGVTLWQPEPLLLPWQAGEWCLVVEQHSAIVRSGACAGFAVELDLLPAMLAAALVETGKPSAVIVYGNNQGADTALLPEELQDVVQWRAGNFFSALMLSNVTTPALAMLQGSYAPRLPLGRWWGTWRKVAILFAVAFALQLVATYADYRNLKNENLALRSAVQESYRKAYPKGAIVDPEKQLQRQLASLRGSAQSSGFVSLLDQVGTVIAAKPGTSIASINYNDKGDEMRMNIVATDFEAVEQVRAAINQAGLDAVMESSSSQGDRVRARLRVGVRS